MTQEQMILQHLKDYETITKKNRYGKYTHFDKYILEERENI